MRAAFVATGSYVDRPPPSQLLYVLRATMVRHTKRQVIAGARVLQLPPKSEEDVAVPLSASERALYLDAHARAAALFHSVRGMAPAYINQRLLQIMSLLNPLRRICSGGVLTGERGRGGGGAGRGGGKGAEGALLHTFNLNAHLTLTKHATTQRQHQQL